MKTIAMAALFGLIGGCTTSSRAPVANQAAPQPEVVDQSYLKQGYRVAHRNGLLLYCRSEAITGTFFRSTVCKTDAEMKAAEQTRQNVADELSRTHGGVCSDPPKCFIRN